MTRAAMKSKEELSIVFGRHGGIKKHRYHCNNRMKGKTSVKCKADQPKIKPERLKLWCNNAKMI